MTDRPSPDAPARAPFSLADGVALVVCTIAWGTTWYAITHQLGVVAETVSVVYRFAIATLLLMAWAAASKQSLRLNVRQHAAAFAMGMATFAIQYPLVYAAEARIASAVVAVLFAAMAFINLLVFRALFGEKPRGTAWIAAAMGVGGVALLSWGEIAAAEMDPTAAAGIALALAGVVVASFGNAGAHAAQQAGASVVASTAWAMFYGTAALALYTQARGIAWTFDARAPYVLSLLYLSIIGSVVAFLLYFGLARRRGFASASYISALTPPVAMVVSTLFEAKTWTISAFAGVIVIVAGQWLISRRGRA